MPQESIRKILVSVKFVSAILGPEMGCANFMDAWKNAFFLQKKTMSIKFLVLGGGGVFWVWGGRGGACRFYFYGRADFSESKLCGVDVHTILGLDVVGKCCRGAVEDRIARSCRHTGPDANSKNRGER